MWGVDGRWGSWWPSSIEFLLWWTGAKGQCGSTIRREKNSAFDDDQLRYSYDTLERLSTTAKQAGLAEARKRVFRVWDL